MEFSDSRNARITTNFDLYKSYSDNPAFREDFSALLFGMVKGLLKGNFGQAA